MDLRAQVHADVAGRVPVDEREGAARVAFLDALSRLTDPFDRWADPTHVTGSAIVTGPDGVLLHRHKRLGLWLQPGGHLDPDETPWDAAVRETREETGLALAPRLEAGAGRPTLAHLDVHDGGRGHTHLDLRYLLSAPAGAVPAPEAGESPDVRWFTWDEAVAVADPGLRGALVHLRRRGPIPQLP